MGSVIDYIECPNCKQEAWCDFYYKTGEEFTDCNNCGYHYSIQIKDAALDAGMKLNELREEDWDVREIKNPYGAFKIKHYDSICTQGGVLESEQDLICLKETVSRHDDIELCTVSRYVDGEIKVETIIDNGPRIDSAGFTQEDNIF
jgi:Zn ribbon nucleic-acid-binding protein